MNIIFKEIFEQSKITAEVAIKRIQELAQLVNAEKLFVAVFANMALCPAEEMNELIYGEVPAKLELLAYHLFPFFGVSQESEITPIHTQKCIEELDKSFRSRIQSREFSDIEIEGVVRPADGFTRYLRINADVVRGSAYPEQTSEEILSIQGKYETWFMERLGVGPLRAHSILYAIEQSENKAVNNFSEKIREKVLEYGTSWEKAKKKNPKERTGKEHNILKMFKKKKYAEFYGFVEALNKEAVIELPVYKERLISEGLKITEEEWKSCCNLIGLTKEIRMTLSDPVEVRQRPLFMLSDNRALLGDISNALDALWDKFEQEARKDQPFYNDRYQKTKSKWLEEKVDKCLSKIFPSEFIYHNLAYPDPDKNNAATTELDIAIHWGPFLILIEAKAKQFRMESQLGDVGRLRTDIKKNVEDAFEQARRAERYIKKVERPEFLEVSTGRKLYLKKSDIHRIYLVTVSQHHLAGIANRLAMAEDLGLFKDGDFPFSICAADLEVISELCPSPDVFLHYIEKRLEIQRIPTMFIADELDLFGAYLKTRLQASRLWEDKGKPIDFVHLTGFQIEFDKWMQFKRGDLKTSPVIKLELPHEINNILIELRKRNDDGARWIAFSLLDMSDDNLSAIAQMIKEVRTATLTPGTFRSVVHQGGDTVVSIVASLDLPHRELRKRVEIRTLLEKYRRRALKSFGIGIMITDRLKSFDSAVWAEGPWKYDPEMEEILKSEPLRVPAPNQKLPGRNDPCICGSRKKFKKCCLPKFEDARKKGLR